MKPIESEPTFIPVEDIISNKYNLSLCPCPLPITNEGSYAHIVIPNTKYICTKCGTEMMLCRGGGEYG